MDLLLIFILASIIGAALVARVMVWATDRATHGAITSNFQASEYILEYHRPPPHWTATARRVWPPQRGKQNVTKAELLARLDELINFFVQCSFFEDEWSREQLLLQLEQERQAWLFNIK